MHAPTARRQLLSAAALVAAVAVTLLATPAAGTQSVEDKKQKMFPYDGGFLAPPRGRPGRKVQWPPAPEDVEVTAGRSGGGSNGRFFDPSRLFWEPPAAGGGDDGRFLPWSRDYWMIHVFGGHDSKVRGNGTREWGGERGAVDAGYRDTRQDTFITFSTREECECEVFQGYIKPWHAISSSPSSSGGDDDEDEDEDEEEEKEQQHVDLDDNDDHYWWRSLNKDKKLGGRGEDKKESIMKIGSSKLFWKRRPLRATIKC